MKRDRKLTAAFADELPVKRDRKRDKTKARDKARRDKAKTRDHFTK